MARRDNLNDFLIDLKYYAGRIGIPVSIRPAPPCRDEGLIFIGLTVVKICVNQFIDYSEGEKALLDLAFTVWRTHDATLAQRVRESVDAIEISDRQEFCLLEALAAACEAVCDFGDGHPPLLPDADDLTPWLQFSYPTCNFQFLADEVVRMGYAFLTDDDVVAGLRDMIAELETDRDTDEAFDGAEGVDGSRAGSGAQR